MVLICKKRYNTAKYYDKKSEEIYTTFLTKGLHDR